MNKTLSFLWRCLLLASLKFLTSCQAADNTYYFTRHSLDEPYAFPVPARELMYLDTRIGIEVLEMQGGDTVIKPEEISAKERPDLSTVKRPSGSIAYPMPAGHMEFWQGLGGAAPAPKLVSYDMTKGSGSLRIIYRARYPDGQCSINLEAIIVSGEDPRFMINLPK